MGKYFIVLCHLCNTYNKVFYPPEGGPDDVSVECTGCKDTFPTKISKGIEVHDYSSSSSTASMNIYMQFLAEQMAIIRANNPSIDNEEAMKKAEKLWRRQLVRRK